MALEDSFGNVSMQTDFINPNQTLRDLSTNAGGTSSTFSRKESIGKEFYVPLKRRLQEKQLNTSIVPQNNIKKI